MSITVTFYFRSSDAEAALSRLREVLALKPARGAERWEAPGLPGRLSSVKQNRGPPPSVLGQGFGADWVDGSLSKKKESPPHFADTWLEWSTGESWNACVDELGLADELLAQARRICDALGLEHFICLPGDCSIEELPEEELPLVTFVARAARASEVFTE